MSVLICLTTNTAHPEIKGKYADNLVRNNPTTWAFGDLKEKAEEAAIEPEKAVVEPEAEEVKAEKPKKKGRRPARK